MKRVITVYAAAAIMTVALSLGSCSDPAAGGFEFTRGSQLDVDNMRFLYVIYRQDPDYDYIVVLRVDEMETTGFVEQSKFPGRANPKLFDVSAFEDLAFVPCDRQEIIGKLRECWFGVPSTVPHGWDVMLEVLDEAGDEIGSMVLDDHLDQSAPARQRFAVLLEDLARIRKQTQPETSAPATIETVPEEFRTGWMLNIVRRNSKADE